MHSSKNIKNIFLNFFKNKSHTFVSSSPLIPHDDHTLLFTNAGMNQFKNFFTGVAEPDYHTAVSAQNCIRAGGKHNDLSEVGYSQRHLTHFVMLGNFAFNNAYFKKEAIVLSWEFLTKELGISKDLLRVTVYKDDIEAYDLWKNEIGITEERIYKLDEKDNFWFMGDSGPCGPCSEIYFDQGISNEADKNSYPSDPLSSRFIEIWNLVFMQYEKKDGKLISLKNKGIDTGMGLERLASVLQKKSSIFETDSFFPLITHLEKLTGVTYNSHNNASFHVLADHTRTIALLSYEGLQPSNEGRGYVLRKIIRRALLFARNLSSQKDILEKLVSFFITSGIFDYPELIKKNEYIKTIVKEETDKFFENLSKGIILFDNFLSKQKNSNIFSGRDAFTLYDTYGFPIEITEVLAKQQNRIINYNQYEEAMEEQRQRSKNQNKDLFQNSSSHITTHTETAFNYHAFEETSTIAEIFVNNTSVKEVEAGKLVTIIPQLSVLYPTGGGQIHDYGTIEINKKIADIVDVKKYQKSIGITCIAPDKIKIGDSCLQLVNKEIRTESEKHHSATHLLFHAIKYYFQDTNIEQDGSFVCNSYLTIDIKMAHQVSNTDRLAIQKIINNCISQGENITEEFKTLAQAQQEGATSTFTEKYNPEKVRVIVIESITKDLCGGCHAKNTKDLGLFILKEVTSSGSGSKRFLGITGAAAYKYLENTDIIINELKKQYSCPVENILSESHKKQQTIEETEKKLQEIKKEFAYLFASVLSTKITTKEVKENLVMSEQVPLILEGYERVIATQILEQKIPILFYSKYETQYAVTIKLPQWDNDKKNKFIQILKEKYQFKGYLKNEIAQGKISYLPLEEIVI